MKPIDRERMKCKKCGLVIDRQSNAARDVYKRIFLTKDVRFPPPNEGFGETNAPSQRRRGVTLNGGGL